jgi:hypothetical protein
MSIQMASELNALGPEDFERAEAHGIMPCYRQDTTKFYEVQKVFQICDLRDAARGGK